MRPPSLDLKNCKVKKVFTNNVNNNNSGAASGSERSLLELQFGGLSPGRLSIFNLDELSPPILERPLRLRRRSGNDFSDTSGDTSMTIAPSSIEPQPAFIYTGPPLLMSPNGYVRSPHRKPELIIKSTIKRFLPRKIYPKPLKYVKPEQRYMPLPTIPEDPEEE